MTQETKEVYEFVHIKCGKKYFLDSLPDEQNPFTCKICGPDKEPVKYSKDKPFVAKSRRLRGDYWTCGNHSTVQKWGIECPECLKNVKPALSIIQTQEEFDKANEKFKAEIEMSKTDTMMRNMVKEKQQAYEQATLDTPALLKQLIGKMDKLAKVMEEK